LFLFYLLHAARSVIKDYRKITGVGLCTLVSVGFFLLDHNDHRRSVSSILYITYCIAEPRAHITCTENLLKFGLLFLRYAMAYYDRQTNRQTDTLITTFRTPIPGKIINTIASEWGFAARSKNSSLLLAFQTFRPHPWSQRIQSTALRVVSYMPRYQTKVERY